MLSNLVREHVKGDLQDVPDAPRALQRGWGEGREDEGEEEREGRGGRGEEDEEDEGDKKRRMIVLTPCKS